MDDLLKWLPVIVVAAGVIAMWAKSDQSRKHTDDLVRKIESYIEEHTREHKGVDKTLTEHGIGLQHTRQEMDAQHTRSNKRVEDLRDEVYGLHGLARRSKSNPNLGGMGGE